MNPLRIKLHTIIIPYLILLGSTIAGYMLLQYVLDITHLAWQPFIGMLLNFWIPILLPLVLVIAVLHKRLTILYTGRAYIFYIVLAYSSITLCLTPATKFILSAPYKLYTVNSAEDINIKDPERFYVIKDFELSTVAGAILPDVEGKGAGLDMVCYTATAFKNKNGVILDNLWHAGTYRKRVRAFGMNKIEFDAEQQQFVDSVRDADNNIAPQKGTYFEVLPDGNERDHILNTLYSVYYFKKDDPLLIKRISEPFGRRYLGPLIKLLLYLLAGAGIFILAVLLPKLQLTNWRRFKDRDGYWLYEEPDQRIKQRGLLQFFMPDKSGLYITPILIISNVLYYIILVLAGKSAVYLNTAEIQAFGGNSAEGLMSGQLWRLLFNSFLHMGFGHLFGNMLSLAAIGSILEPYIGRKRFLAAYITCSILGSINSLLWKMYTVSAGASIPIAGMSGLLLALFLFGKVKKEDRKILFLVLGVNIVELILVFNETNIDNGGHIGGFITGIIVGIAFIIIDMMSENKTLIKKSLSH